MCDSNTFRSYSNNEEYKIDSSFDCDSSNVVYLMECRVCGVHYVGSTQGRRNDLNVEGLTKRDLFSNSPYQMLEIPGPPESKECKCFVRK